MKIKISKNVIGIGNLCYGECFEYNGMFFMKVDTAGEIGKEFSNWAIGIGNGRLRYFLNTERLIRLPNATFCPEEE